MLVQFHYKTSHDARFSARGYSSRPPAGASPVTAPGHLPLAATRNRIVRLQHTLASRCMDRMQGICATLPLLMQHHTIPRGQLSCPPTHNTRRRISNSLLALDCKCDAMNAYRCRRPDSTDRCKSRLLIGYPATGRTTPPWHCGQNRFHMSVGVLQPAQQIPEHTSSVVFKPAGRLHSCRLGTQGCTLAWN